MMWSVGADSSSAAMSTAVGSGVRTTRQAITMIAIFATVGAVLEGWRVERILGKGIVLGELPMYAAAAIVLATALFGSGILFRFVPVGPAYAVIGATIGAGFFLGYSINWFQIALVLVGWMLTPVLSGFLALLCSWIIVPTIRLRIDSPLMIHRIYAVLLTLSGSLTAYTIGANRVGFATGPLSVVAEINPAILSVVAIVGLVSGPLTLGRRFLETKITDLDAGQAVSAEFGTSIAVYILNLFGVPISFNTANVGGIVGAGLSKGVGMLRRGALKRMAIALPVSFFLSGTAAYIFAYTITYFGGI